MSGRGVTVSGLRRRSDVGGPQLRSLRAAQRSVGGLNKASFELRIIGRAWKPLVAAAGSLGVALSPLAPAIAQEREDRTLLPWEQLHAIINEASGERALHTVLESTPYPRIRARAEYEGHFRENEVIARLAKDYGFAEVKIESFASPRPSWQAWRGELWLTGPEKRKLYDINDVAIALAPNSKGGDVTAEVIDVGIGARPEDYAGRSVAGKVVLGTASPAILQQLGVFETLARAISEDVVVPEAWGCCAYAGDRGMLHPEFTA